VIAVSGEARNLDEARAGRNRAWPPIWAQ